METPRFPRIVISQPGSPPYVRHAVRSLYENGMLEYFATTYVDHPDYWLSRTLRRLAGTVSAAALRQLDRRAFADIPMSCIRTRATLELVRTFFSVANFPRAADMAWEIQEHDFDRWVAGTLPLGIDAVYGFEHAALETFRRAKRQNAFRILEQPSQHSSFYTRIHEQQLRLYPEIKNAATILASGPAAERRDQRRNGEIALADCILCNSSFTKRTLVEHGVDPARIEVTPYGFPPPVENAERHNDRVVFLNAGTQSLRKGIHLLLRAWRSLNLSEDVAELWLVGKMLLPESLRRDLPGKVRILNSIPHADLMRLYQEASVFVLPSLADGFAMVITEAMSRGLPVIGTDHTGALDVIEHGQTGWVIPAGDEDALRAQMLWCVAHREELPGIGKRAARRAAQWQWSDYRSSLSAKVRRRLEEQRTRHVRQAPDELTPLARS